MAAPENQNPRIHTWLLGEELFPPFRDLNLLSELRNITGDKYWESGPSVSYRNVMALKLEFN